MKKEGKVRKTKKEEEMPVDGYPDNMPQEHQEKKIESEPIGKLDETMSKNATQEFKDRTTKAYEEINQVLQKYGLILIPTMTMKESEEAMMKNMLRPKGDKILSKEDVNKKDDTLTIKKKDA